LRARRLAAVASPRNTFQREIEMKLLAKVLGFGLAIVAASTACAAAASLSLGSNNLSAGNVPVTPCGSLPSLVTRNVNNLGNVTQVVVPGVPAACAGETISITLLNATNVSLGSASATVPVGGGAITFTSVTFGTVSATALMSYRFAVVGA
jgi:hypothetical protein